MRARVLLGAAVAGMTALSLGGCGTGHEDEVRSAADAWSSSVQDGDWAAACDLLAPATLDELEQSARQPCAQALEAAASSSGEEPEKVHVYGTQAQVAYAGETLFLGEFGGRWLVWAAGCTPTFEDRPFDCRISGG